MGPDNYTTEVMVIEMQNRRVVGACVAAGGILSL